MFWLYYNIYLLYKYSEHPSNPSSSSSHFSAGVSWSDNVAANKHAPDSTKNLTIAKLLQLAAQCNGVQPSESWAFTSQPYSTRNLYYLYNGYVLGSNCLMHINR